MLIAVNQQTEQVSLLGLSQQAIEGYRKQPHYCPTCQEEVILKNGLTKQGHFAHQPQSKCQVFSEGETREHLLGKALLAQWCQRSQVSYQLEAYLSDLKQRPDLLIAKEVAVEFQCSPLNYQRFLERTKKYHEAGYQVLWFLGRRFFLQKAFSQFQKGCLNVSQERGFYLWELKVAEKILTCQSHLTAQLMSNKVHQGSVESYRGRTNFIEFIKTPQKKAKLSVNQWQLRIFEELESQLRNPQSSVVKIQKELYALGLNLRELSTSLFIPQNRSVLVPEELLMRGFLWLTLSHYSGKVLSYQQLQTLFFEKWQKSITHPILSSQKVLQEVFDTYLVTQSQLGYLLLKEDKIYVKQQPEKFKQWHSRQAELRKYQEKDSIFQQQLQQL